MRMSSNMPTYADAANPATPVPSLRHARNSLTPPPLPKPQARHSPAPLLARLKKTTRLLPAASAAPFPVDADLTTKLAHALAKTPRRGHRIMRQQPDPASPQSQMASVHGLAARTARPPLKLEDFDDGADDLSTEPAVVASPDWLMNARRERRRSKFRNASSWLLAIVATLAFTAIAGIVLVGGPQNLAPILKAVPALFGI